MEKPILFKSDMVRAILDGRKTQTRRIIDFKKIYKQSGCTKGRLFYSETFKSWAVDGNGGADMNLVKCPYGKVGDKLWVREGFCIKQSCCNVDLARENVLGYWIADDIHFSRTLTKKESELFNNRKRPFAKTSGRFMYKSLTRLWLEVTGVRVERVQDINVEDVLCEGIKYDDRTEFYQNGYIEAFKALWDSINKDRGYGWDKNPWVWVIEFKAIKP